MRIVYASRTGNVTRFVQKLALPAQKITSGQEQVQEPCVLITYTTGMGEVPEEIQRFMQHNHQHVLAVAGSGNRNWGKNYARSADRIAQQWNIPVLMKFELSGRPEDVACFLEGAQRLEHHLHPEQEFAQPRTQQSGAAEERRLLPT